MRGALQGLLLSLVVGCTPPIKDAVLDDDDGSSTGGAAYDDGSATNDCDEGVGIIDCEMDCWTSDVLTLLGDGVCDEGDRGPDFSCTEWSFDDGDCTPGHQQCPVC